MKSVFLENKGHYNTSVNGNVIDEAKWNVDYDGKTANLEADFEKAVADFITAKQLLEDMAGFVFGLTD